VTLLQVSSKQESLPLDHHAYLAYNIANTATVTLLESNSRLALLM